jgi:hypothetical protein
MKKDSHHKKTMVHRVMKEGVKKPVRKRTTRKWSATVTKKSNALDLEQSIFRSKSAKKIAGSLKASAEKSKRKKGTPFQSAMSMLNFYINRAGKNLTKKEKQPLEKAKDELRKLYKKKKVK